VVEKILKRRASSGPHDGTGGASQKNEKCIHDKAENKKSHKKEGLEKQGTTNKARDVGFERVMAFPSNF